MVRVVQSADESLNGVMATSVALKNAAELGVDLVEIVPNQDPPICRIVEYSKFRYEMKLREKENKSKQHVALMKEIRFGPHTDEHDFNFKLKHAQNFLQEGHKVKAVVHFRGRTIVYKEQGEKLLLEFAQALADDGKVESMPRLEGKRMHIIVTPKGAPKKVVKAEEKTKDKDKKDKKPKSEGRPEARPNDQEVDNTTDISDSE